MQTVNVHAAKTHFSRLVDRAAAGEEIIIAKGKEPVARLQPIAPSQPRRLAGSMKGKWPNLPDSFFFDPLPEEELRLYEGGGDDENPA